MAFDASGIMIENIRSLYDENTNSFSIIVDGTGIVNADDFQQIDLRIFDYDINMSHLSLSASNLYAKLGISNGSFGRIKGGNNGEFQLQFELKPSYALPYLPANDGGSFSVSLSGKDTSGDYFSQEVEHSNITFDYRTVFPESETSGLLGEIVEYDVDNIGTDANGYHIFRIHGKVTHGPSAEFTNHIHIKQNLEVEGGDYSAPSEHGLFGIIGTDAIDAEGNFGIEINSYGKFETFTEKDAKLTVVSNAGTFSHLVSAEAGAPFDIAEPDTHNFFITDYIDNSNIIETSNMGNGFYAVPGEFLSLDYDHKFFEDTIDYENIQNWGGDDIEGWLSLGANGELTGLVPIDFDVGYFNLKANSLMHDIEINRYFEVRNPFSEAGDQVRIGENWANDGMGNGVFINSKTENVIFDGENIAAYQITLSDGSEYSVNIYDEFRGTKGIETHSSPYNDYIDLSGYSPNDFSVPSWKVADITTSMGNDIYIAPSFKIDGKYVGVLDNQHYFDQKEMHNLDASQGLELNFLGDGVVEIIDNANGFKSRAENITQVQTSQYSDDTVHGDADANSLYSYGGHDTFFGGGGEDYFTISNHQHENHKISIEDYQSGETIRLSNFDFTDDFINEGKISYDKAQDKTYLTKVQDDGSSRMLVEVGGYWEVDKFYRSDGGESVFVKLSNPFDDLDTIVQGTNGNDFLAVSGKPHVGDGNDIKYTSKNLEFYGYEGRDDIAGSAGNDFLDGGEEQETNRWGRDIGADGNHVVDRLYYLDAPSGIDANFEIGIVYDDGFGSGDRVINFERVYGSYHSDQVVLSDSIFGGYMPLYGNDNISSQFDVNSVNNPYLGYWNLENETSGLEPSASKDVTEAHIVVNYDAGTVDKFITGGEFDLVDGLPDYQDTFVGIEGVIGSRGADVMYAHSSLGTSTIIDGERSYTFGWLLAYEGDDKVIALGSGDDSIDGGGGDDLLISVGTGSDIDKLAGMEGLEIGPNLEFSDVDTFVIGGKGQALIEDYEVGEDLILLDYDISNLDDFETIYDFSTDTTRLSIMDGGEVLENRILIRGNFEVSAFEVVQFYEEALAGSADPSLNNTQDDYKLTLIASTNVAGETILGGTGDDVIVGTDGVELVRTGGGNDKVYSGANDDVVVVQGQGDVEVDTGAGDDRVVVEDDWSGTLLLKNGAGLNTLYIDQYIKGSGTWEDGSGKFEFTLADDSKIVVENQFVINENGINEISENGFQYTVFKGWDGFAEQLNDYMWGGLTGTSGADILELPVQQEDNVINFLSGRGGNDELIIGGGLNQIWGGAGDDIFKISGAEQITQIVGDEMVDPYITGNGLEDIFLHTQNSSYSDVVEIDWSYDASEITQIGSGYRIYNEDLDATVDIYDVEILKFANGDGTWDTRYLTDGAPIGGGF